MKSAHAKGPWTATSRYETSGLRTHNFPQPGTEVSRFKAPSVRRANEDDNKLDDYLSNGIMQRHTGGESLFIVLHEPFAKEPWIKLVTTEGETLVAKYKLDGRVVEDRIDLKDNRAAVVSSIG
ncbi:MAG: hypothetical protein H7069_00310 [Phormidesmis sp. FL-bin-119]|nr:hypothetical protein [Pedobacter sp.]